MSPAPRARAANPPRKIIPEDADFFHVNSCRTQNTSPCCPGKRTRRRRPASSCSTAPCAAHTACASASVSAAPRAAVAARSARRRCAHDDELGGPDTTAALRRREKEAPAVLDAQAPAAPGHEGVHARRRVAREHARELGRTRLAIHTRAPDAEPGGSPELFLVPGHALAHQEARHARVQRRPRARAPAAGLADFAHEPRGEVVRGLGAPDLDDDISVVGAGGAGRLDDHLELIEHPHVEQRRRALCRGQQIADAVRGERRRRRARPRPCPRAPRPMHRGGRAVAPRTPHAPRARATCTHGAWRRGLSSRVVVQHGGREAFVEHGRIFGARHDRPKEVAHNRLAAQHVPHGGGTAVPLFKYSRVRAAVVTFRYFRHARSPAHGRRGPTPRGAGCRATRVGGPTHTRRPSARARPTRTRACRWPRASHGTCAR